MTTKITEKNISSIANAGVQWQSVHVADGSTALTATAGKGYFIDTTSGAQTVNVPSLDDSTLGDTILLKDFARQWGTNNVTMGSNTFDGVAAQTPTFSTNGQTVTLVFMGNTKGWSLINEDTTTGLGTQYVEATGGTITTTGDFKIHAFTGDGCFVVSNGGNSAGSNTVDYLVVAGGGGSGGYNGGGGGGGGFRTSNSTCMPGPQTSPLASPTGLPVSAQTYPVSVGAGGAAGNAAGTSAPYMGTIGSNSVFSTITSTGGGYGGKNGCNGGNGGSGGGQGGEGGPTNAGGTGNTPPVSPPQGGNGGNGGIAPCGRASGGGGGAAENGAGGRDGNTACGGAGGTGGFVVQSGFGGCNGTTGPVSGARYFSGGGGGGTESAPTIPGGLGSNGAGGSGGGGQGGQGPTTRGPGTAGTANTGGGAGGASRYNCNGTYGNPAAGGKGIVLVRYKFQN